MNYTFRINDLSTTERDEIYNWLEKHATGTVVRQQARGHLPYPVFKSRPFIINTDENLLWNLIVVLDNNDAAMHFKLAHPNAKQDTKQ